MFVFDNKMTMDKGWLQHLLRR